MAAVGGEGREEVRSKPTRAADWR